MKKNKWIVLAMILGAVFFSAVFIIKPIGVSTQFSVLSGILHSAADPSVITEAEDRSSGYHSTNAYYDKSEGKLAKNIRNPINYDFIFVLSIPLGAFAGVWLNRRKQTGKKQPERVEEMPAAPKGRFRRYFPSFAGGFLLLYGARMADGCTSGHMMSGMMQGSVSGYLFAASVFAVAIPIAILTGRRYRIKGGQ